MPSVRSFTPVTTANASEIPYLSREWLEGRLSRPERPVNPLPAPIGEDYEHLDILIASFQNWRGIGQPATASNSAGTIDSSVDSDSG